MDLLVWLSDVVWGVPLLTLILSVGIYYSFATGFIQLRGIKRSISYLAASVKKSGSAYSAFASALAATVGTGSVVGVAVALSLGGPGGIFWMWVSALFGMAIAFAEGVLSIKYRTRSSEGVKGGMMYVIRLGLGSKALAFAYALFATLACFGMGIMTQVGSATQSLWAEFSLPPTVTGGLLCALVSICSIAGSRKISRLCSWFVPILSVGYILLTLAVIAANIGNLPKALWDIFSCAFGFKPLAGGVAGFGIKTAISQGIRRGVFSNEAGLGTTASLHASAEGVTPRMQGHINMLEVAADTLVICTLTALAILTSGVSLAGDGTQMLIAAFGSVFGVLAGKPVALSVSLFAIATAVGWVSIGKSSFDYLTHGKLRPLYTLLVCLFAFFGGAYSMESAILISDIFNGLMAVPCLTALILLRKDVIREAHSLPVEPKPCSPRSD